jgi:hypothetical protein
MLNIHNPGTGHIDSFNGLKSSLQKYITLLPAA